jgi:2-polyprenyl-3-methyl-5-hydroxy-6-metoxy-1,4-benzoquinol methylase
LCSQIDIVEKSCKEWGVLGLFGITLCGSYGGHVIDLQGHSRFLPLPQKVQSLDEICLIIRRDSSLKFDENIGGFHFYGGDLCLEAEVKGFTNFAIDACVKHLGQGKMDAEFWRTERRLSNKWRHRNSPRRVLITTCAFVRVQRGVKSWAQTNLFWLNFKLRHMFPLFFPLGDDRRDNLSADIDNKTIGLLPRYYEWIRYDIFDVVPALAKCILSVGCGGGITEAKLVRQGVKVVGVEINSEAAKIARQRGLTILEGDVSKIDVSVAGELYDCIIYGDVLEHLQDPLSVLQRHVASLKKNGTVIVSVPNFRHYSVLWQLFVHGHVRYVDAGIFDRTHLRITTRKMVLEWFAMAGLRTTFLKYVIGGRRYRLISAASFGLFREFIASQILAVGRKD